MYPTDSAPSESSPAGSSLPKVILEITRGRARHKRRDVRSAAFLIGSAADCDLVLGDPRFDELHSYLYLSEQRVTIRHLGSGPPLCVSDRTVAATTLEDADRVQLGPYEFQVSIDWPRCEQVRQPAPRRLLGQMDDSLENDRALERLLRDIERQSAPAVRLFVGEGVPVPTKTCTAPHASAQIAQTSSRKAGL